MEEQYSLSLLHTLCSFSFSQGEAESRGSLSSTAWLKCCCPLLLQLMESTWDISALAVAESHNISGLICLCTYGFTEPGAGSSSSLQPQPMADWMASRYLGNVFSCHHWPVHRARSLEQGIGNFFTQASRPQGHEVNKPSRRFISFFLRHYQEPLEETCVGTGSAPWKCIRVPPV